MIISKAWEMYLKDKQLLGYSKYTLKAYKIQVNLLIRSIGDKNIENIELTDLKEYLFEASQYLKPSSVNHRQRFIRSLFSWAHSEGFITKNPAHKLREMKEPQRIPRVLSEENLEMLREGCESAREHALVEIFFASGCRLSEVTSLNKDCINWERRTFIVNGKGSKERECYFTVRAMIWLKKYLNSRKDNDMALFVTERAPHRLSKERIREIIKEIAKKSNIDTNVYPHILRGSYATHLLNNGAPLEVIQEFLGHSKIETTRIYCQLSGERRRELYRKYM
ncbi:MAG: tyrosine-type recombinase/integrase [Candidatus Pacebacteria bacterium]|nr:tyrosine-type recombinase/integrase [Candidatus Paceibacterota bacterium]